MEEIDTSTTVTDGKVGPHSGCFHGRSHWEYYQKVITCEVRNRYLTLVYGQFLRHLQEVVQEP